MGWVVAIKNMIVESIPALSKRSKTKDLLVKGAKKTGTCVCPVLVRVLMCVLY